VVDECISLTCFDSNSAALPADCKVADCFGCSAVLPVLQDPMGSAYLAGGAQFTRELSLLQRNAEAGALQGMSLAAAVTRRLSADAESAAEADAAAAEEQQQQQQGGAAGGAGRLSSDRV
jgi:hypothetical protein